MQVSYNAIIREMDAEELQEELERVKADKSMFTTGKLFEIERNYEQLTGKSLITQQTK